MTKYKILKADKQYGIYEFLVDKESDLKTLPKRIGSIAYIVDNNSKYICNNAKEWKILNNSTNSGDDSSGAGGDVMIVNMTVYNHVHDGLQVDKTFAEIEQAILAGTDVILRQKDIDDGELTFVSDYQFMALEPEAYVDFATATIFVMDDNPTVFYNGFKINSNNEVSEIYNTYPKPSGPIG